MRSGGDDGEWLPYGYFSSASEAERAAEALAKQEKELTGERLVQRVERELQWANE